VVQQSCVCTAGSPLTVVSLTKIVTKHGFGKHIWNINIDNEVLIYKVRLSQVRMKVLAKIVYCQLFYTIELLYVFVVVLTKMSLIAFYLRVFPQRWFRWACFCTVGFLVTHGLAFFFVMTFQCTPVSAFWDRTIVGKCVNQRNVLFAGAGVSIAEDLLILVLPIPLVVKLNVGFWKKVALASMFSLGSLYVFPHPMCVFIHEARGTD
jgi:hypothetical protein